MYEFYARKPVPWDTTRSRAHATLTPKEDKAEKCLASRVQYRAIYDEGDSTSTIYPDATANFATDDNFMTFQPHGTLAELEAYYRRRERRSKWMKKTRYIHLDEFTGSEHDSEVIAWTGASEGLVELRRLRSQNLIRGALFPKRPILPHPTTYNSNITDSLLVFE